eukprot:maker-scaffold1035_size68272-snap-gene-0.12 protein:Tk07532 transcript:maker-scaffold1035_size68272-snap-gene-0.12-mRNA-1 annotation:"hypothetical protein DAPPUDRAFT_310184"
MSANEQAFTLNKVQSIPSFSKAQASLLSWSLSPRLARSSVADSDPRLTPITNRLDVTLTNSKYNGSYEKLIQAVAPKCSEFILECQFGLDALTGLECCQTYFDPTPIINQYGTCFTTRGSFQRYLVTQAGEGNGVSITTMHEDAEVFDASLSSPSIYGAKGVNMAIVDEHTSVETALQTRGQSVQLGTLATVGILRNYVDNSDLEFSLIGRMECTEPGARNADLEAYLVGIPNDYGYSRDNCETSKQEILARELINCTFNPSSSGFE